MTWRNILKKRCPARLWRGAIATGSISPKLPQCSDGCLCLGNRCSCTDGGKWRVRRQVRDPGRGSQRPQYHWPPRRRHIMRCMAASGNVKDATYRIVEIKDVNNAEASQKVSARKLWELSQDLELVFVHPFVFHLVWEHFQCGSIPGCRTAKITTSTFVLQHLEQGLKSFFALCTKALSGITTKGLQPRKPINNIAANRFLDDSMAAIVLMYLLHWTVFVWYLAFLKNLKSLIF